MSSFKYFLNNCWSKLLINYLIIIDLIIWIWPPNATAIICVGPSRVPLQIVQGFPFYGILIKDILQNLEEIRRSLEGFSYVIICFVRIKDILMILFRNISDKIPSQLLGDVLREILKKFFTDPSNIFLDKFLATILMKLWTEKRKI